MKKEFEVPGFHGRLSTQLYKLQQTGQMCDAFLVANNGTVPVHKLILMASRSPVLLVSPTVSSQTLLEVLQPFGKTLLKKVVHFMVHYMENKKIRSI